MGSDKYGSGILSEEFLTVYDHDPRDIRVGHASCFPACKPIDKLATGKRDWRTFDGEPITEPDHIAFLEARKAGIKWH
jgi:hypothetical protein